MSAMNGRNAAKSSTDLTNIIKAPLQLKEYVALSFILVDFNFI
jgi:hypothetical protein